MCGTRSDDLVLKASLETQTFRFTGLRRFNSKGSAGSERYDACYYIIEAPKGILKTGQVKVRFTRVSNVLVYWSGGVSSENVTQLFNDGSGISEASIEYLNRWYSLDKELQFLIVVIPDENKNRTLIEFQYVAEGEEYSPLVKWYYENFTGNEEREESFLWMVVGTSLVAALCLCCCFYFSYRVCCTGGISAKSGQKGSPIDWTPRTVNKERR